jgi:hypothetical protein
MFRSCQNGSDGAANASVHARKGGSTALGKTVGRVSGVRDA